MARRYSLDIANNNWPFTGDSMAFDTNGQMVNGQHRCLAVMSSGRSIETVMVTGVDPGVRPFVDIQRKRTLVDAIDTSGILGKSWKSVGDNTSAGVWPAMRAGMSSRGGSPPSTADILGFVDDYRDAGVFALDLFSHHPRTQGVTVAPVIAAVARAYYHCDRGALERFVEVLCTGFQRNPREDVIIMLREWLRRETQSAKRGSLRRARSTNQAGEVYGKTARAIMAFADGQSLRRLYMPPTEPLPLPVVAKAGVTVGIGW